MTPARRFAPALLVLTLAPALHAEPKIADPDGTPVTIVSSHTDTEVFIARGPVNSRNAPEAFEPLGVAPVDVKLAPGTYTLESTGPTQSLGHQIITVDHWPVKIEIRTGDATVKTLGTILIALGVVSILAGIVVVVSFGQGDKAFDKYPLAIPLLAGGAGAAGIGVGMSFLGATNIGPVLAPKPAAPTGAQAILSLRF